MAVVHQSVYIPICAVCVGIFQNGREIRIALLMYCRISVYDMITLRAMRVIWDVCSVLLSCTHTSAATFGSPLIILQVSKGETG